MDHTIELVLATLPVIFLSYKHILICAKVAVSGAMTLPSAWALVQRVLDISFSLCAAPATTKSEVQSNEGWARIECKARSLAFRSPDAVVILQLVWTWLQWVITKTRDMLSSMRKYHSGIVVSLWQLLAGIQLLAGLKIHGGDWLARWLPAGFKMRHQCSPLACHKWCSQDSSAHPAMQVCHTTASHHK